MKTFLRNHSIMASATESSLWYKCFRNYKYFYTTVRVMWWVSVSLSGFWSCGVIFRVFWGVLIYGGLNITSLMASTWNESFFSQWNLHKNLFFAVFGQKLDLEAVCGDLSRVLPVFQALLLLFLTIRWCVRGSRILGTRWNKLLIVQKTEKTIRIAFQTPPVPLRGSPPWVRWFLWSRVAPPTLACWAWFAERPEWRMRWRTRKACRLGPSWSSSY